MFDDGSDRVNRYRVTSHNIAQLDWFSLTSDEFSNVINHHDNSDIELKRKHEWALLFLILFNRL